MQIVLSVTVMFEPLSVVITHVTVSVDVTQLEVSAALMQLTVSASNLLVTIFIAFMQVEVSVEIMQVDLFAVHNCFYCKIQVTVSLIAMQVTISSNSFIFSKWHPLFITLSGKHLNTLYQVCILPHLLIFFQN